jgi:6-phosphogluconate dehydrogenase
MKEERIAASKVLRAPETPSILMAAAHHIGHHAAPGEEQENWLDAVRDALYCSKICAYAQGFALMGAASRANNWDLSLGTLAQIWRGGCIIRARFLQKITDAFGRNPALTNLLIDPYFAGAIDKAQNNWRKVVARAAVTGVPIPAFASALAYFDSYRSPNLTANLLQAQRDYFGAHTYERTDQPRGSFFHLDWPDPKRPQLNA